MADKKSGKKGTEEAKAKAVVVEEKKLTPLEQLKVQVALVRRSTDTQEPRYVVRALRKSNATRALVSGAVLRNVIVAELTANDDSSFASLLPEDDGSAQAMETGDDEVAVPDKKAPVKASLELETYLQLLTVIRLIDDQRYQDASQCASKLIEKLKSFSRATLNPIASKAFFYYSRAFELVGGAAYAGIRSALLSAHITASLQHANEVQLTILNLLLRNYLHHSLFDQADKLAAKSGRITSMLQDGSVSNNQIARYLYYVGRIKAVQLAYGTAFELLEESLRKAPRHAARGFRLATYKLLTIVQLLMGDIPERSVFRQEGMAGELRVYLLLAKAVRVGDLGGYNKAVQENMAALVRDNTLTLVTRLRHNVIKTGLRKINLAYSRIGFEDICRKLHLDNIKDAEYIVAKAIRDGVVEATIDHVGKFMQSKSQINVYSTEEPYEQFHKRIEFSLNLRNDAVKAMRFPETSEPADVLKPDDKDSKKDAFVDVDESAALDALDDDLED